VTSLAEIRREREGERDVERNEEKIGIFRGDGGEIDF
jgi:hypothetical protein